MKELILEKLKKIFLPYKGKKEFEYNLEKNFKNIDIFKMYGTEMYFVKDNSLSILFIQKREELVIMLFSDYNKYLKGAKFNLVPRSVSKIDIISSDKWKKKNKELLDIVEYISNHSSDTIYDYFVNGITHDDFNSDYLFSPIYWQLNERLIGFRTVDKKIKSGFFKYSILIILNSLSKKIDIENINVDELKNNLFKKIYYGLLNDKTRLFTFNEIINYRNKLLSSTFYLSLFKRVKYNRDEWNVFFETEVFENFNQEFFDFVKGLELDQDNNHKKIILRLLMNSKIFNSELSYVEIANLYVNITDQDYLDISNDIHDNLERLLDRPLFRQRYNIKIDNIDEFELETLKKHSKFYDLRNTMGSQPAKRAEESPFKINLNEGF